MKMTKGLTSSNTEMWGTPKSLFQDLDKEFHFDCDVCASSGMEMTKKYYSPEIDGLKQDWSENSSNWMNPPYGKEIPKWMKKASESNINIVCLIPARTDTEWWHRYIMNKAYEVRFVKGRIKFVGNSENSAPFPSAIVIYKKDHKVRNTKMKIYEQKKVKE